MLCTEIQDVDGTLIKSIGQSASELHAKAFSHCFKEAFGLDTRIDAVKHQGSTDPLIILAVLDAHGLDPRQALDIMPKLIELMNDYFNEHIDEGGSGLQVLPGVVELLEHLKNRGDVITGLVTGNTQPIAWGKMKALGVYDLFTPSPFGGFGSDYWSGNFKESWKDRSELIRIAGKKGRDLVGGAISKAFHIGDAPMDMAAAQEAGVTGIGVTTGVYSKQTLIDAGAAIVLDSLENLQHILSILQLDEAGRRRNS